MAKLYFYFSAMNAGKTTLLLQSSYNYQERGMETVVYTPACDTRYGSAVVASRIGLQAPAITFDESSNLFEDVVRRIATAGKKMHCVLIDEAQFMTKAHVEQVAQVVDELNIPVLTYGLRTDFTGQLFEASQRLLALADELIEIKTICHCGRKATMVLRLDTSGKPIKSGSQIAVGGNDLYISVCRKHFNREEIA